MESDCKIFFIYQKQLAVELLNNLATHEFRVKELRDMVNILKMHYRMKCMKTQQIIQEDVKMFVVVF